MHMQTLTYLRWMSRLSELISLLRLYLVKCRCVRRCLTWAIGRQIIRRLDSRPAVTKGTWPNLPNRQQVGRLYKDFTVASAVACYVLYVFFVRLNAVNIC